MASLVPKPHLNYLLGHKPNANLARTTYQVPNRPIDNSGLWFNQESTNMNTVNFHSSIACGRDQDSLPTVSDEVLHGN